MNKLKFTIIFIIISILILSVVQTVISNTLSTSGVLLGKIDKEINYYKTENLKLSEKLFLASSLSTIASQASSLGFVEGKSQYVITTSKTLAIRQ